MYLIEMSEQLKKHMMIQQKRRKKEKLRWSESESETESLCAGIHAADLCKALVVSKSLGQVVQQVRYTELWWSRLVRPRRPRIHALNCC